MSYRTASRPKVKRGTGMKKKFCPYCDQELKSMYCRGCKRVIFHPYEQDIDYLLNERHLRSEESCQYHGDLHTGSMKKEPEVILKRRNGHVDNQYHPGRVAESAGQTGKRAEKQAEKRLEKRPNQQAAGYGSRTGMPEPKKKRRSLTPVIIAIWALLTFGGTLFGLVGNMVATVEDMGKLFAPAAPEPMPEYLGQDDPAPEEVVSFPAQEETFEWEVSDEEVKKAGIACNSFGHYPFQAGDAEALLASEMETASFDKWEQTGEYSFNQDIDGSTWYETEYEYDVFKSGGYKGTLRLYSDTATGELHGAGVIAWEEDAFYELTDVLAGMFISMEVLPEGISGRKLYEEVLDANTEGLDGFSTQYGPEILCQKNADAGDTLYEMTIYAPGYFTDAE